MLSSSPEKQGKVKFHLTALDIHPTVMARNLVFLLLLDDLAQGLKNGMKAEDEAEIKATFMYAFAGTIMPPYCQTRCVRGSLLERLACRVHKYAFRLLEKTRGVRERLLSNPPDMPSWIYVHPGSAPSMVSALDYWLKAAPKKTLKGILKHHELKGPLDFFNDLSEMAGVSPAFKASLSKTEGQVAAVVDSFSDAELQAKGICPPDLSMPEAREFVKKFMLEEFLKDQGIRGGGGDGGGPNIFEKEVDWYKEMNCFYPPRELEKRHPGLVALKKQVMEQEARGEHPNPDKQVVYVVRIPFPFPFVLWAWVERGFAYGRFPIH